MADYNMPQWLSAKGGPGWRGKQAFRNNTRKILEVMDKSLAFLVVMLSQVYTYVRNCQVVYFK